MSNDNVCKVTLVLWMSKCLLCHLVFTRWLLPSSGQIIERRKISKQQCNRLTRLPGLTVSGMFIDWLINFSFSRSSKTLRQGSKIVCINLKCWLSHLKKNGILSGSSVTFYCLCSSLYIHHSFIYTNRMKMHILVPHFIYSSIQGTGLRVQSKYKFIWM